MRTEPRRCRITKATCALGYAACFVLTAGNGCTPEGWRSEGSKNDTGRAPEDTPIAWRTDGALLFRRMDPLVSGDVRDADCGATGLYTVLDGRETAVATSEGACALLWRADEVGLVAVSPDWRFLAYGRIDDSGGISLRRARIPMLEEETIASECPGLFHMAPAWSSQAGRIAYSSACRNPGGSATIRLIGPDGDHPRRVTRAEDGVHHISPTWSPSARQIAFVRFRYTVDGSSASDVVVTDTVGASRHFLGMGHSPAWSPTGEWIAYVRESADPHERSSIRLVRPDGRDDHPLFVSLEPDVFRRGWASIPSGAPGGPLAWSMDGRTLAFTRAFESGISIWAIDVGEAEPRRLTKHP